MAHGGSSFLRARRIPLVPSLATTISDVGFNAGDHRVDGEHYPDLYDVALAHTWASVGCASGLGDGAGIRMRSTGGCNHVAAQEQK